MNTTQLKQLCFLGAIAFLGLACSEVKFNPEASQGFFNVDPDEPIEPLPPVDPPAPPQPPAPELVLVSDSFSQKATARAADILMVIDNSDSMYIDHQQGRIANQFRGFGQALQGLDVRLAITTTDVRELRTAGWGGELDRVGTKNHLSGSELANEATLLSKIHRQEAVDCRHSRGSLPCGSNDEQALAAVVRALELKDSSNQSFFRPDAELILFLVSDEDEFSEGQSEQATKPEQVIRAVRQHLGAEKKLRSFGVIVQPEDSACLRSQRRQELFGQAAHYGRYIQSLADLTGGWTASICQSNIVQNFSKFYEELKQDRATERVYLLSHPLSDLNSVRVKLTPEQNLKWWIEGQQIVFEQAPIAGTTIEVEYLTKKD